MHGNSSTLEQLTAVTPGLRQAIAEIVDRRERSGRLPRSVTLSASPETVEALRRVFSARAVVNAGKGRVRLELGHFLRGTGKSEGDVDALLYGALGRTPRNIAAEARALRESLERRLTLLAAETRRPASTDYVKSFLVDLTNSDSSMALRAQTEGVERVLDDVGAVVRCVDALAEITEPIRIQNFAARVLGSSKALRPGSELFRAVGTALVEHDPKTRQALDEQGVPPHRSTEIARALEVNGVYYDEAAASVLCFGPLVYEKRGRRFDHVLQHSRLGESSRIIVQQLRGAELEKPRARRVTVFENLTPYLDYVDLCVERGIEDEVVLCSGGQASWAVISALAGLARFQLPMRHSGDLDRAGVQILRSLAKRSGARVVPLLMDAETHVRFAGCGEELSAEERRRVAHLIAQDAGTEPGHDLLCAVLESGRWIEQEKFLDARLLATLV